MLRTIAVSDVWILFFKNQQWTLKLLETVCTNPYRVTVPKEVVSAYDYESTL